MNDSSPAPDEKLIAEVLDGLSLSLRALPCRLFYDAEGSRLFEEICELKEYYLTRTETAILEQHARDMARHLGPEVVLVEPGAGSGRKTEILLAALDRPSAYVPVDISASALAGCAQRLSLTLPELAVLPVRADFTRGFALPKKTPDGLRAIFFPGSTIGNFAPAQAGELLSRLAASTGQGGALLLGADRKKDPEMLVRAYDDARGVTARFNLNILEVVNRELGGDFRLDRFRHRALYDETHGRIEMHLVSAERQEVHLLGRTFLFEEGETLHTENSYKYDRGDLEALARGGGYTIERVWSDEDELFSVLLLRA